MMVHYCCWRFSPVLWLSSAHSLPSNLSSFWPVTRAFCFIEFIIYNARDSVWRVNTTSTLAAAYTGKAWGGVHFTSKSPSLLSALVSVIDFFSWEHFPSWVIFLSGYYYSFATRFTQPDVRWDSCREWNLFCRILSFTEKSEPLLSCEMVK